MASLPFRGSIILAALVKRINESFDLSIRAYTPQELVGKLIGEARSNEEVANLIVNMGSQAKGSGVLEQLLRGLEGRHGTNEAVNYMRDLERTLKRAKFRRSFQEILELRHVGLRLAAITGESNRFKGAKSLGELKGRVLAYVREKGRGEAERLRVRMQERMLVEGVVSTGVDRAIKGVLKGVADRELMELKEGQRKEAASRKMKMQRLVSQRIKEEGVATVVTQMMWEQRGIRLEIEKLDKRIESAVGAELKELLKEKRALNEDYAKYSRLMRLAISESVVKGKVRGKEVPLGDKLDAKLDRARMDRKKLLSPQGGNIEHYWDWVLTSGKYRGKTVGWLYDNKKAYFIQAHNQDGVRGWSLLNSMDRKRVDALVANSPDIQTEVDRYWEDRGNRDPKSLEVFGGWSKEDFGPKGDRKRQKVKKVKKRDGTLDEEVMDRSPLRGDRSYDPEKRLSDDAYEVRRELFGAAWQRAREDYQRYGDWKEARRGGKKVWKRRDVVSGKWEFRRRNPEGWKMNMWYEIEQSNEEWRRKFELAQEVVKLRTGKKATVQEVEREMASMGDLVELHVKKKKLEYMLDQGYLKGERALIGKEYEGMTREERDRERAKIVLSGVDEGGEEWNAAGGSFEDGRNRVRMGRDNVERFGHIGKDDVPLWMRVEEAKSEEELDRLQEEIYGEFGEVNVRRLEARAGREGHTGIQVGMSEENDLGVSQGWGIGKLMQEKRNVLRAAKSV